MTLRFVSAGAAQGLVKHVAARDGVAIDGIFGAVGAMHDALVAGEPCDIVILTRAQIAELATRGMVTEGSIRDLGAVATSIAVRDADRSPDVSGAHALAAALRAADAIYFPDPLKSTAGVHFAHVLRELGLHEELASRCRTFPNGSTAMATMAQAEGHPIGCTQATEILATPRVRLVAPLPPGLNLDTTYTAALRIGARDVLAAMRFIDALTGAGSVGLRASAGFR
jgi:molybdate transport system substrate-binding protein